VKTFWTPGIAIAFVLCVFIASWGIYILERNDMQSKQSLLPTPDRFVAPSFSVADATVYEFRNSQGGTCVLALRGTWSDDPMQLWCMRQLPPVDYEDLPSTTFDPKPQ
jgi:hypothetical protein